MGRKIQKNLPHAFETNEAEKNIKERKVQKALGHNINQANTLPWS